MCKQWGKSDAECAKVTCVDTKCQGLRRRRELRNLGEKSSGTKCAVGKMLEGTRCIDCPKGKYQDQIGATQCKLCEPNTYNAKIAQSSCTRCSDGWTTSMAGALAPVAVILLLFL